jgi:translation elongation factor EF-Tu-like GTPase
VDKPTAKYKITDTFKITGRGLVFTGTVLEGNVNSGDSIEFTVLGKVRHRQISGISLVSRPTQNQNDISLLIKCVDENEIDELRNWTPENSIGLIYKKDS